MTSSSADHHGSHRDLLWAVHSSGSPQNIDAIIVPTARRPAYLMEAAGLALALNCTLVTIHSKQWTNAAKAASRFPRDLDFIAIDLPDCAQLNQPMWKTSELLKGTVFARTTDLSAKRNMGLMLSRLAGWSRILFLDDDITRLNPKDVRWASGALNVYNAVGLQLTGFPNHSVVCHAYRLVGGGQQSFVSGSALTVQTARTDSFFPDIYNDDWFFLLDGDKGLQPVGMAGEAGQYPYDPFRSPGRARAQALGDVLSEGVYWVLDQGGSFADADLGHWAQFLQRRQKFILLLINEIQKNPAFACEEKVRMIAALKGSLGRLALITPELCHMYMRAWSADGQAWRRHLERLPRGPGKRFDADGARSRALLALTRPGAPSLPWQVGSRGN